MNKKSGSLLVCLLALAVLLGQGAHGQTGQPLHSMTQTNQADLCNTVDQKPVLSLQQINQAEMVHYLIAINPEMQTPPPEGMPPEEYYQKETQMLLDAGYPPAFAEVEPDRLVTRRYFASLMFQVAVATDEEFARKHGDLTDETEQMQALMEEEWLYAEQGSIYREEILSVLCVHQPEIEKLEAIAIDVEPEDIREGTLESDLSPL